jgi:hypothetical protein
MVFEQIIRHSPRRRALPWLAEGFSPTASAVYRIYFSISINRTPEQLPTFQRSTLPRSNLQRSTFNLQRSTFNVQRSTLPRSTFNVRNSSAAWRSAIEIASGRLFAGRPPAWTLPRRPHRRSPGAKRPLRRGFNRTPEQLPTFQRSTLPRSHVPTFNAPTFPRSTFNVQRSTFQPSTFNVPTFHPQRSTFQPSTFNVQRSTFNVQPSTFNVPTFNVQRSTFNLQPSTFNVQRSTFNPHSRTGTPRSARYCLTSRIV